MVSVQTLNLLVTRKPRARFHSLDLWVERIFERRMSRMHSRGTEWHTRIPSFSGGSRF